MGSRKPQSEVANARRGRQSTADRASELDRKHHPRDVRLDVVWHSETRIDDHVTFVLIARCSEHHCIAGFCCLSPALMAITYRFPLV